MYSTLEIENLRNLIWDYYHDHGRDMPWREPPFDPYRIMVSEVMLQQTQVGRVIPKYQAFLATFPDVQHLARARVADIYPLWNGLGYNRRAKFLQTAAKVVMEQFKGQFPDTPETLMKLPGVGKNTAGAIMAYAYNQPVVFVETNIRTVIIYHLFPDQEQVTDQSVLAALGDLLDREHSREFYWALMDYGSHLKTTVGNAARASKHYVKQSRFTGSRRQLRGMVLRELADAPRNQLDLQQLTPDDRLVEVLKQLTAEGMIRLHKGIYSIA